MHNLPRMSRFCGVLVSVEKCWHAIQSMGQFGIFVFEHKKALRLIPRPVLTR